MNNIQNILLKLIDLPSFLGLTENIEWLYFIGALQLLLRGNIIAISLGFIYPLQIIWPSVAPWKIEIIDFIGLLVMFGFNLFYYSNSKFNKNFWGLNTIFFASVIGIESFASWDSLIVNLTIFIMATVFLINCENSKLPSTKIENAQSNLIEYLIIISLGFTLVTSSFLILNQGFYIQLTSPISASFLPNLNAKAIIFMMALFGLLIILSCWPFTNNLIKVFSLSSGMTIGYLPIYLKVIGVLILKLFIGIQLLKMIGTILVIYSSIYGLLNGNIRQSFIHISFIHLGFLFIFATENNFIEFIENANNFMLAQVAAVLFGAFLKEKIQVNFYDELNGENYLGIFSIFVLLVIGFTIIVLPVSYLFSFIDNDSNQYYKFITLVGYICTIAIICLNKLFNFRIVSFITSERMNIISLLLTFYSLWSVNNYLEKYLNFDNLTTVLLLTTSGLWLGIMCSVLKQRKKIIDTDEIFSFSYSINMKSEHLFLIKTEERFYSLFQKLSSYNLSIAITGIFLILILLLF